jgi:hypothetical protein
MSKAAAWANQALDHALYVQSPYVAVAYMKPPVIDPYQASRWYVTPLPTRGDLDQWYQGLVGTPDRYHYLAAFDKTTPEWDQGSAVAAVATDSDHHVGVHLAPEAYRPAALHAVARRAPPSDARTWLYVSLESGNAITRPLDDYASAMNMLGAYFSSAAAGMLPDVSYWAILVLGPSGPQILHDAAISQSTSVGAVPTQEKLHHLDRIIGQHETFWAAIAQHHPVPLLREFLHDHWDPFLTYYFARRAAFDTPQGIEAFRQELRQAPGYLEQVGEPPADLKAAWVDNHALQLSELRELAAYNGIPTPDLGTSRHGILHSEPAYVSGVSGVSGIFDDIGGALKSAVSDVAKVVQHPPAWLAVAMPLFTPGTQKWWAKKIGGKTGEALYDAGTQAVVKKALGPAGPKLLGAFNSVMDAAASGHLNAQEMIAKAPQIAHLAQAAQQGPAALQQAIFATGSHITMPSVAGYLESPEDQKVSVHSGALYNSARRGESAMYPHQRNARYHDPQIGHWLLPLALGVPAGAFGGYYYRKWRDEHPGKYIPWISGEADASEDLDALAHELSEMFSIPLDQMRAQLAEIASSGATPDQIRDKVTEIASAMGISVGGEPWQSIIGGDPWQSIIGGDPWQSIIGGDPWQSIIGGDPWVSIVGQAGQVLDVLRRQARAAVEGMPSRVIGVVRDANNKWVIKSFRDADVADDWFARVVRDKSRFTYAAYFDKGDPLFPYPLNEEIGGAQAPSIPPPSIPRVVAEI